MHFIKTHPARIYAVAVAALALVAHYVPALPSALVLGLVAAVLGTGEAIQRTEDRKTAGAGEGIEVGRQGDDQGDADELSA
ncbi:hypothetical protein [Streptomyces sp. OspMP-M43]|uniref:hypothetical protein n=1 Tax=Streptomyces sp. OspMP-M43 TaxID=1839781 RepID=UPI00081B5AAB|nr:hypothetical protein [Streptomyces sp. OspMP-M43]SCD35282.1 hypothetical protein GA0115261_100085 [Streptomyces sp. OspMP-M43]